MRRGGGGAGKTCVFDFGVYEILIFHMFCQNTTVTRSSSVPRHAYYSFSAPQSSFKQNGEML